MSILVSQFHLHPPPNQYRNYLGHIDVIVDVVRDEALGAEAARADVVA